MILADSSCAFVPLTLHIDSRRVRMHVCMYVCICIYVCIYVYMCVCMYTYMYICAYVSKSSTSCLPMVLTVSTTGVVLVARWKAGRKSTKKKYTIKKIPHASPRCSRVSATEVVFVARCYALEPRLASLAPLLQCVEVRCSRL